MSNFPSNFDNDITLPFVNDNLTEIGAEAINAVRDAVFNTQQYLGLGGAGTTGSIASRIGVSLNPDGTLKPSAIVGLGLVTLPITNAEVASNAEIQESKLRLDYRTSDLFNYITDLSININTALGWISSTGSKLDPHLLGFAFNHTLSQISVTDNPSLGFKNKFKNFRDNSNSFTSLTELNNELLYHQFADGYATGSIQSIITNDGTSSYPSSYAHISKGIFIDTDRFGVVPQTANDLQKFAEYIDSASIFLLGSRIQNLYSNGISRESRSANLVVDGYGQSIISPTTVTTYLLNIGSNSEPFDDINTGDDIIEFKPASADVSSNLFDSKFSLVKIGDMIKVNYDGVEVTHLIKEKKYVQSAGNKKYIVRIDGKNLKYSTTATARIDKPLLNLNKYGVLSVSAVNNNFSGTPSLIAVSPRSASVLGVGFNPDLIDSTHYVLYLALYPTGNPADGYTILPGIDITGNAGTTPGKYTLDSIVEATNNAFRSTGYNYRFTAFQYQGEFGIALADSFNNSAFSIFSGIIASNGSYDASATAIAFPNNVVGVTTTTSLLPADPLGFGPSNANIASPPYKTSFDTADAAQTPTKIFIPLKRNNFYVNGIELEKLNLDVNQIQDSYGDGYWIATVHSKNIYPGPSPVGRVETTYKIPLNLETSGLAVGKTIVVQSLGTGTVINFGRFIIQGLSLSCTDDEFTYITVYDAVHANAVSPANTLDVNSTVAIYLDSGSITFNKESATDLSVVTPFKRHFEVFVNQTGEIFTHERARLNASNSTININGTIPLYTYSELNKLNIIKVSPKLRGYQFQNINKISLYITEFTSTGSYTGYLCYYNGLSYINIGPTITGKIGAVTRFYDETNIDYIDILFDLETSVSAFNDKVIDFQLFPTLSLDNEIMLIATCQLNDVNKKVTHLRDERQFGNISEKDLSTSALNYISKSEKLLHSNGIIQGFDLKNTPQNPNSNQIYINGGVALVNGKFVQMNNQTVAIPIVLEFYSGTKYDINWALCVNDKNEYQPVPLLDYDLFLGTPSNTNRLFQAFNPANGLTYNLEAYTFSDLINNKKNLTILYIVSSDVTEPVGNNPPTISLSLTDARKYVNDIDSNLELKFTSKNSQGNFKNIESIFNWLKYNSSFNSVAILKGLDINSGQINSSLTLDFNKKVILDGLNDAHIVINEPITLGSNITFKNLTITFKNLISVLSGASNILFENCDIIITNELATSAPVNNVIFNILNGNNIKFINCNIDASYVRNETSGALFYLNNTQKFSVDNSIIELDFNANRSDGYVPGSMFIIKNSSNVELTKSSFEGNFAMCIRNTHSNGLIVKDSTIISTYSPRASGTSDIFDATSDNLNISDGLSAITFDFVNSVNSGRGFIYSKINTSLDNIIIENVEFVHNPIESEVEEYSRFSFINFELSTNVSILSNSLIKNCKFRTGKPEEVDYRSAISIINIASSVATTQPQPILKNVHIENNFCNKSQGMTLSSMTSSGRMIYPGLVTENCSIIKNTCGYIGYWVASSSRTIGTVEGSSLIKSTLTTKDSNLIISGNSCHFIGSVDHAGKYFSVLQHDGISPTLNNCDYPSGNVFIEKNVCNWIATNVSFEEHSSLRIQNNTLTAYDVTYLISLGMTITTLIAPYYAITVFSNKKVIPSTQSPGEGNDAACIISDNTTSAGYWLRTDTTKVVYKYFYGYIYCNSSCIITNNILKGIENSLNGSNLTKLIAVAGVTNIIKNNKIYRANSLIANYICFLSFTLPYWSGGGSYGIVTDNFCDSAAVNTVATEWKLSANEIPSNWIAERNINQTCYTLIPLTNGNQMGYNFIYYTSPDLNISLDSDRSLILNINDSRGGLGTPLIWSFQENLNKHLPNDVRIVDVQIGVCGNGAPIAVDPTYKITLGLHSYAEGSSNFYPTANSYIDLTNPEINKWSASLQVDITSAEINSTSNTIIKNLGGGFTLNSHTSPVVIGLTARLLKDTLTNLDVKISPIAIKYRW